MLFDNNLHNCLRLFVDLCVHVYSAVCTFTTSNSCQQFSVTLLYDNLVLLFVSYFEDKSSHYGAAFASQFEINVLFLFECIIKITTITDF